MRNKKKIILTLVIVLAIGFATVSTTLVLNGIIGVSSDDNDFNIIFTSTKLNNVMRNDFIDKERRQTINFETDRLTNLDEEAILDYEVTNTSRLYDADIEVSCNMVDDENNIIESNNYILINYEPTSMIVEAGNKKNGRITARLIKVTTEDQSIKVKCTLNANAIERDILGENYAEPFSKAGTMMAANFSSSSGNWYTTGAFWDYKDNILKLVFEDEMVSHETTEDLIFDVSENQDKSVMAYLVPLTEDEKNVKVKEYIELSTGMTLEEYKQLLMEHEGMTLEEFNTHMESIRNYMFAEDAYILYIQSETGVIANPNSGYLFFSFERMMDIEGLEYFYTGNVKNMIAMFAYCSSLNTLDVSNFNTSNVTNMNYMFNDCNNLITLDVSSFDTSNVTSMNKMFWFCSRLTTLDLSNFDTSNVTDMYHMFDGCNNLITLDVSSFDTSNVTDMSSMFSSCSSLITLNVNNFDTSKVTNMSYMFSSCSSLTTLNISNFDVSNAKNMGYMFRSCSNLKELYIGRVDINNNASISYIFNNVSTNVIIHIKDNLTKDWILEMNSYYRPSEWNDDNFILET